MDRHESTDSIPQDALQSKENTLQLDIEEVWQGRENIAESRKINERKGNFVMQGIALWLARLPAVRRVPDSNLGPVYLRVR